MTIILLTIKMIWLKVIFCLSSKS